MFTKVGHCEILSALAKSPTGTLYEENDSQSHTIALKVIRRDAFGEALNACVTVRAVLSSGQEGRACQP